MDWKQVLPTEQEKNWLRIMDGSPLLQPSLMVCMGRCKTQDDWVELLARVQNFSTTTSSHVLPDRSDFLQKTPQLPKELVSFVQTLLYPHLLRYARTRVGLTAISLLRRVQTFKNDGKDVKREIDLKAVSGAGAGQHTLSSSSKESSRQSTIPSSNEASGGQSSLDRSSNASLSSVTADRNKTTIDSKEKTTIEPHVLPKWETNVWYAQHQFLRHKLPKLWVRKECAKLQKQMSLLPANGIEQMAMRVSHTMLQEAKTPRMRSWVADLFDHFKPTPYHWAMNRAGKNPKDWADACWQICKRGLYPLLTAHFANGVRMGESVPPEMVERKLWFQEAGRSIGVFATKANIISLQQWKDAALAYFQEVSSKTKGKELPFDGHDLDAQENAIRVYLHSTERLLADGRITVQCREDAWMSFPFRERMDHIFEEVANS